MIKRRTVLQYRNIRKTTEEIRIKRDRFSGHLDEYGQNEEKSKGENEENEKAKTGCKWVIELR